MKQYLILIAALAAFIFAAYWAGTRIGYADARTECAERIAAADAERNAAVINANNARAAKLAEQKRKINEEVYNTGIADIRDRLRAKYTIAD
jgi:hypothetical protein